MRVYVCVLRSLFWFQHLCNCSNGSRPSYQTLKFLFILLPWRLGVWQNSVLALPLFPISTSAWIFGGKQVLVPLKFKSAGFLVQFFSFSSSSQGCCFCVCIFFLCQTSIYRTAVKYLTSFSSTSLWFERRQSCQIICHPYGNIEQKKKMYEYFCTVCNKEIFMPHEKKI